MIHDRRLSCNDPRMNEFISELIGRFNPHPWKIIGLTGAVLFGCRWLVQAWASRKAGQVVVPVSFWVMSVVGSLLTLLYFVFYRVDSVGILTNLPPFALATYNLQLTLKKPRQSA
jgi:lipid-A-disaccharide synthase-like uncharacterized protein